MVRVREVRRGVFFTAVGCFITGWIITNFLRFCFNSLKTSLILLLFGGYDILVFFIHVKIKIRWASWIWQGQSTELQSLFLKYSLAPPRHCNSRNIDFYFSKTCQNKKEDMKSHSFDICTCKNLHSLICMVYLSWASESNFVNFHVFCNCHSRCWSITWYQVYNAWWKTSLENTHRHKNTIASLWLW